MGKRIDAETRAKIVQTYLENDVMPYTNVAKKFGVATETARRIIKTDLQSGTGIKPDRRSKKIELPDDDVLDQKHREALQDRHPRTTDWMDHVKPLNARKRELELAVEHKQAKLDKAKQELRDLMATLRQLMEGDV